MLRLLYSILFPALTRWLIVIFYMQTLGGITCQVTCWLCLSANSHHLNVLGSSTVCCHLPDPLRSWFHHRGGQMGWQETLTEDHSEPPTERWARSRGERSRCSAKTRNGGQYRFSQNSGGITATSELWVAKATCHSHLMLSLLNKAFLSRIQLRLLHGNVESST